MKKDSQIQKDIIDELSFEPALNEKEIGVAVKEGVVTLTGTVSSYYEKRLAEQAAEKVEGVRGLAEELQIKLGSASTRTDADIARAVAHALEWNFSVPHRDIKNKVENGWVTLEGNVEWYYQKSSAENAIESLIGVRGVTNLISVEPKISAIEVKEKIESALKRRAELDSQNISVRAEKGKVVLSGKVSSWAEREDARKAAWSAPGVSQVETNLKIAA